MAAVSEKNLSATQSGSAPGTETVNADKGAGEQTAAKSKSMAKAKRLPRAKAKDELNKLWDHGRAPAKSGANDTYFSAMFGALELAESQFGSDSSEFAQANNHMIGAYSGIGKMQEARCRWSLRSNASARSWDCLSQAQLE